MVFILVPDGRLQPKAPRRYNTEMFVHQFTQSELLLSLFCSVQSWSIPHRKP